MDDLYLVEVSVNYEKQDNPYTWHISTLSKTIRGNINNILEKKANNTWYIVGYAPTSAEASVLCEEIKKTLEEPYKT